MTDYKQLCAELLDWTRLLIEIPDPPVTRCADDLTDLLARTRAALAEPEPDISYEFVVSNDEGCTEAGGTAPTLPQAIDEGRHYLAQYSQDGKYTLEIRRIEVLPIPY